MLTRPAPEKQDTGAGRERKLRSRRALVVVGAIACLALMLGAAWPHVVAKNFGVVVPGKIYRSGELTVAALADVVDDHGIRTIIDFGAWEEGEPGENLEAMAATSLGVERVVLRLEGDGSGDPTMYLHALRIMSDPAKQPVLIHCAAGAERTGCAVVLYRNIVQGVEIDRAYEEAKAFRHDPERNERLRPIIDFILEPVRDAYANDLPTVTLPTPPASGSPSGSGSGSP